MLGLRFSVNEAGFNSMYIDVRDFKEHKFRVMFCREGNLILEGVVVAEFKF